MNKPPSQGRNDADTTIADLQEWLREFTHSRKWDKFHNAKDMAIMVSTEAAELLELFRFKDPQHVDKMFSDSEKLEAITDEIADVIISTMMLADRYNIDISTEIRRKLAKSAKKYPVETSKADHIDKVAWVYIKNEKLLGVRTRGENVYYLPGGKREGSESDLQCLQRELKEELGISVKPDTAKFLGQFAAQAHGTTAGKEVVIKCWQSSFAGKIAPAGEIEELDWIGAEDLDSQHISLATKTVLAHLVKEGLVR